MPAKDTRTFDELVREHREKGGDNGWTESDAAGCLTAPKVLVPEDAQNEGPPC